MTPRDAIAILYRRQADFAGRSGRAEALLALAFVLLVLGAVMGPVAWVLFPELFGRPASASAQGLRLAMGEVLGGLAFWAIFTVKPVAALLVRRLHDLDRSGRGLAVLLVPGAGLIVLIWWLVQKGTEGANRFGPQV